MKLVEEFQLDSRLLTHTFAFTFNQVDRNIYSPCCSTSLCGVVGGCGGVGWVAVVGGEVDWVVDGRYCSISASKER